MYEIKEIDVILRHTFKETYSWTELAPYKQLLQLQVNNRTRVRAINYYLIFMNRRLISLFCNPIFLYFTVC